MQGLVVVGLIFEEISHIYVKCVKGTGVQNKGQGHRVKVPAKSRRSTIQGLVAEGLIVEDTWKGDVKGVGQWSAKYRLSQATFRVRTLRRSSMQDLVVVGLIVEEILNVNVKCEKGTGAQNIGQGHRVKVPAESVHLGEALCKVW